MTYRKFVLAGAVSATVGLLGSAALAQVGQQQRQQQQRTGQLTAINGEELLNQLEGNWNVRVTIYDMDALEGQHITQPGQPARPGTQPMTPGAGHQQQQQIEQQLRQAFTRAGMSQQDAQRSAQQLAQRIVRERPERQQLKQIIQQEMTRAGVTQQQAQQEAQRIAGQIHPLTQQDGQRTQQDGEPLRPEDDPTAPPIRPGTQEDRTAPTPGQPARPGTTPDRERPGVAPGQVQFRGEGNATRSWTLNETFLQEELTFTVERDGTAQHQQRQQQFREPRINLRNGDEYEAMGLFAFEPMNGELCMVWADNTKSMLHYGIGQYDTAQQAMVFYTINPKNVQLPHAAGRPGAAPMQRPGVGGPQDYRETRPGQQDRPGVGQQDRPGVGQQDRTGTGQQAGQERIHLNQQGNRVVLRIISDNEHVVYVYRDNGIGQASQVMEINYTRN